MLPSGTSRSPPLTPLRTLVRTCRRVHASRGACHGTPHSSARPAQLLGLSARRNDAVLRPTRPRIAAATAHIDVGSASPQHCRDGRHERSGRGCADHHGVACAEIDHAAQTKPPPTTRWREPADEAPIATGDGGVELDRGSAISGRPWLQVCCPQPRRATVRVGTRQGPRLRQHEGADHARGARR